MPEDSRYFEGRDHSETEVAEVWADFSEEGVYQHADQRLRVYAPGGLQINIEAGRAIVQGFWYRSTAVLGVTLGYNATGSIRYDRIVLRLERLSNRVKLYIRAGTPGGGVPALQRAIGGDWEISLAYIRVGPAVTDIVAADIVDERGYTSVCGWANRSTFIGSPSVNGLANLAAFADDTDTGIQNAANDMMQFICGTKPMGYVSSSTVILGSYNTPIALVGGGAPGAPQNRIYADAEYVFVGHNIGAGAGPSQIHVGTSLRAGYVIIGHNGSAAAAPQVQLVGNVVWLQPVNSNASLIFEGQEGYSTGLTLRNAPAYNKQLQITLATGGGQGLGGVGDASIYTAGGAAGQLILGSQGAGRVFINSGVVSFGPQPTRSTGFNFQQTANADAYGIRLWYSNTVSWIDWHMNQDGNSAWGLNGTPRMWLDPSGMFTVGGTVHRGTGSNFQQGINHPWYGIRLWHTNGAQRAEWYVDDTGRIVFSLSDTPQMWLFNGVPTFGGGSARPSGMNYQQQANTSQWGFRQWHTNTVWHADFYIAEGGHTAFAAQDVSGLFISQGGAVTIGAAPTDNAQLAIPARYGDTESSGVRLINGPGNARWWVASTGVMTFGTAGCQIVFTHGATAITPQTNNVTALGTAAAMWSSIHSTALTVVNQVATQINPPSSAGGSLGTAALLWNNLYCTNGFKPGANTWSTTSDERLKIPESIRPFTDGMTRLRSFEPILFRYNGQYGIATEDEYVGFSAQHLQQVAPEMVSSEKMRRDEDAEEEDILVVNTGPLIYMLLNAMKELDGRMSALEARA